jgi:hypothetical protein
VIACVGTTYPAEKAVATERVKMQAARRYVLLKIIKQVMSKNLIKFINHMLSTILIRTKNSILEVVNRFRGQSTAKDYILEI